MSQTDGPGVDCKSIAREFDSFLVHMSDRKVYVICPRCKGNGEILKRGSYVTCPKCKGYKTVEKK